MAKAILGFMAGAWFTAAIELFGFSEIGTPPAWFIANSMLLIIAGIVAAVRAGLWRCFTRWVLGEVILEHHENGGSVILVRTVMITVLLFALSQFLLWSFGSHDPPLSLISQWAEKGSPGAYYPAKTWVNQCADNIPWAGAIAAVVYTALYSRFASQWSYLANLYNQIKQCEVESARSEDSARPDATQINYWKAGYIEDAETLHLLRKREFATIASNWLQNPGVFAALEHERGVDGASDLRKVADAFKRHCPSAKPNATDP